MLTPMFEEIHDNKEPVPEDSLRSLNSLMKSLESAKRLLRFGAEISQIYLVHTIFIYAFVAVTYIYLIMLADCFE